MLFQTDCRPLGSDEWRSGLFGRLGKGIISRTENIADVAHLFPLYLQALEYDASFESSSRYSREKECIWPWLMLSLLVVIHPVLQARWEKQVVPQLVNHWREKKSLLFSSRSQPEQLLPLLLAQVNGKRRVGTQCLPQLLLLLESSLLIFVFFLLVAKSNKSASTKLAWCSSEIWNLMCINYSVQNCFANTTSMPVNWISHNS